MDRRERWAEPVEALRAALDRLFADAEAAIAQGATILVVSDTAMTADKAPIPALLACAGLHHHLIRAGLRHACGISYCYFQPAV